MSAAATWWATEPPSSGMRAVPDAVVPRGAEDNGHDGQGARGDGHDHACCGGFRARPRPPTGGGPSCLADSEQVQAMHLPQSLALSQVD